jgi:hypothetical protein
MSACFRMEVLLEGRRARRAEGPWRGAISLRSGTGPGPWGALARAVPAARGGGSQGRAHRYRWRWRCRREGGTRADSRRGTPRVRGRAPLAPPVEAWGTSRSPSYLSMPHQALPPARQTGHSLALAFESLPIAGPDADPASREAVLSLSKGHRIFTVASGG